MDKKPAKKQIPQRVPVPVEIPPGMPEELALIRHVLTHGGANGEDKRLRVYRSMKKNRADRALLMKRKFDLEDEYREWCIEHGKFNQDTNKIVDEGLDKCVEVVERILNERKSRKVASRRSKGTGRQPEVEDRPSEEGAGEQAGQAGPDGDVPTRPVLLDQHVCLAIQPEDFG